MGQMWQISFEPRQHGTMTSGQIFYLFSTTQASDLFLAFVIAKVGKGDQRRCRSVAAFHWQWLYGQGPARATTRFINAVKSPLNGRLIKADLEAFNGYEARIGYGAELAVPFPYISMLYRMLTYIGVDDEYFGECQILSVDMASSG
jgi:hypothetical protein